MDQLASSLLGQVMDGPVCLELGLSLATEVGPEGEYDLVAQLELKWG